MTDSADEWVKKVVANLRAQFQVDVATEGYAGKSDRTPAEALAEGAQFLRQRARKLHAVQAELSSIAAQFVAESSVVAYSEIGWPDLSDRIKGALKNDEIDGTSQWLDAWFEAAALGRFACLDWLVDDIELPAASALLKNRAKTATAGLRWRNSGVADPMLRTGVDGVMLAGGQQVPKAEIRSALAMLRLRLAVETKCEAETYKGLSAEAASTGDTLTLSALHNRWLRKCDVRDGEDVPVFTIEEAANLDVAVELILAEDAQQSPEYSVKIARKAVDGISALRKPKEVIDSLLTDVPPEIWIEAADRAVNQDNQDDFDSCLGAAHFGDEPNEYLWGRYFEVQAAGFQTFGEPSDKAAMAWRNAGSNFLWTQNHKRALKCMKAAYTLQPEDVGHLMSYGEALRVNHWEQLAPAARAPYETEMTSVLEQFYAQFEKSAPDLQTAWCHACASRLHNSLAHSGGYDRTTEIWRSFVAAARGVLVDRKSWPEWAAVAAAAYNLEFEQLDLVFARKAFTIEDNVATRDDLCRVMFNAAKFEELDDLLDPTRSEFATGVAIFLNYYKGDYERAVGLFYDANISHRFNWVWECVISALILLEKYEDAVGISREFDEFWHEAPNDIDGARAMALCHLVMGDAARARDTVAWAAEENEAARLDLGIFEMLAGDVGQGIARCCDVAHTTSSSIMAAMWSQQTRLWIAAVCEMNRFPMPDLGTIDAAFSQRLTELRRTSTPNRELDTAEIEAVPHLEPARTGVALGRILLALAEHGVEAASDALDRVREDLSPQDRAIAEAGLSTSEAESKPDELQVEQPAEDEAPTPARIRLFVSARWFEDHPDPVQTHPIFRRWLTEARVWFPELPAVLVKDDHDFKDGQYVIEIDGVRVDEGYFPPTPRRFPEGTQKLFGLSDDAVTPAEEGYICIPNAPGGPLADLLEVTCVEMVLQRLREICKNALAEA